MRTTLAPFAAIAIAATAFLSGCSLLGLESIEDMQLAAGECIDDSIVGEEGEQEVGALPVVDCAEPHTAEVYYVEDLPDGDFNPVTVGNTADEACYDEFEPFMGIAYESSDYYISSIVPSYETWERGDRQVACLIVGEVGEELTGSLKGSAA